MPEVETPPAKVHWATKARLEREAAAAAGKASAPEPVEGESEESRAAAIAAAVRGTDLGASGPMAPSAKEPLALAPNPNADTIEGIVGIPDGDKPTYIAGMEPDDVKMLVEKLQRFIQPKAPPAAPMRVRQTTFVTQAKSVPEVRAPQTVSAGRVAPALPAFKPEVEGKVMNFVEFCNRRFAAMDNESVRAVMGSSQPQPAFATLRKMYVAYAWAVRHAAEAEGYAQSGQMD